MTRSYDLLLQPLTPGAPFDVDAVLKALALRGLVREANGWALPLVSRTLEVRPLHENGVGVAVEVRVPLAEHTAALEEAVKWAVDVARVLDLRVLDPQLGSVVTGWSSAVNDEFLRTARYAGEYLGVSEALGASSLSEHHEGLTLSTRMLLAFIVFLVVVWGTFRVVAELRSSRSPEAASQRSR